MSETNNYPERQIDICDHEVFCVGEIRQFIYPVSGYLEVDFTGPLFKDPELLSKYFGESPVVWRPLIVKFSVRLYPQHNKLKGMINDINPIDHYQHETEWSLTEQEKRYFLPKMSNYVKYLTGKSIEEVSSVHILDKETMDNFVHYLLRMEENV